MKKLCVIILSFVLIFSFTACSQGKTDISSSNVNSDQYKEDNDLFYNANTITKILVTSADVNSELPDSEFNLLYILTQFAISDDDVLRYSGWFKTTTADDVYCYDRKTVQQICDELFGKNIYDAVDILQNSRGEYDHQTESIDFCVSIGWGVSSYCTGEYVYSGYGDDKSEIITTFELLKSVPDEEMENFGRYVAIYKVIDGDNGKYLQLQEIKPESNVI